MKRFFIICIALLFLNCSTTQLVDTWRNPDVPEYSSDKILIVGMTADKKARKRFEKKLKEAYEARGIQAVMSLDVFDVSLTEDEKTEEELKALEDDLIADGFDSILFSKVVGVDDEMAYSSTYKDLDRDYRSFRDDYFTNQDIYYNPEYYVKYKVYHAETALYCMCPTEDMELVWKGYIDIVDPESSKKTIDDYVHLVMYALEQEELLNKKMILDEDSTTY